MVLNIVFQVAIGIKVYHIGVELGALHQACSHSFGRCAVCAEAGIFLENMCATLLAKHHLVSLAVEQHLGKCLALSVNVGVITYFYHSYFLAVAHCQNFVIGALIVHLFVKHRVVEIGFRASSVLEICYTYHKIVVGIECITRQARNQIVDRGGIHFLEHIVLCHCRCAHYQRGE